METEGQDRAFFVKDSQCFNWESQCSYFISNITPDNTTRQPICLQNIYTGSVGLHLEEMQAFVDVKTFLVPVVSKNRTCQMFCWPGKPVAALHARMSAPHLTNADFSEHRFYLRRAL